MKRTCLILLLLFAFNKPTLAIDTPTRTNGGTVAFFNSNGELEVPYGMEHIASLSNVISYDPTYCVAAREGGTVWLTCLTHFGGSTEVLYRDCWWQNPHISDVKSVKHSGYNAIAFLKNDGTVWTCGRNEDGQLGNPDYSTVELDQAPVQVWNLYDVNKIISMHGTFVVLKDDGTVWGWGRNSITHILGDVSGAQPVPIQINDVSNVTDIVVMGASIVALCNDGTVLRWGWITEENGGYYQLPTAIALPTIVNITGDSTGFFKGSDDVVYGLGAIPNQAYAYEPTVVSISSDVVATSYCNPVLMLIGHKMYKYSVDTNNNVGSTPEEVTCDHDVLAINGGPTYHCAIIDSDGSTSETTPVYRAYNPNADYHFFTTSKAEFDNAVACGYSDECTAPSSFPFHIFPTERNGTVPIYRMYNPNNGRHYYTTSAGERDVLNLMGWEWQGAKIEGYVYSEQYGSTTKIFKLYNQNTGAHLYTVDADEAAGILAAHPGIWVEHTPLGYAYAQPK